MFSDKIKEIIANIVASFTVKQVLNDLREVPFVSVMIHSFSRLNLKPNHLIDIIILR